MSIEKPQIGEKFNPYDYPVARAVWRMPKTAVPQGAKAVYDRLVQLAGKDNTSHPSLSTLADDIGVTKRHVIEMIKRLVAAKLIEKETRPISANRKALAANGYKFLWHEQFAEVQPYPRKLHQVVKSSSPVKSNTVVLKPGEETQTSDSQSAKPALSESTIAVRVSDPIRRILEQAMSADGVQRAVRDEDVGKAYVACKGDVQSAVCSVQERIDRKIHAGGRGKYRVKDPSYYIPCIVEDIKRRQAWIESAMPSEFMPIARAASMSYDLDALEAVAA